jgi:hypothetical protein
MLNSVRSAFELQGHVETPAGLEPASNEVGLRPVDLMCGSLLSLER